MTNPSNAVGTNGAYGGRTSVDALNDVLGAFNGAGVLSGWNVRADSGMSVLVGGQSGVRDVAVAQDQLGDRTTINNRLGSPISITLAGSSPSTARVDSIVLYVNKPATVSTTTIDNPGACGIIAVNGTTTAPSEATIRSAISTDGGTGATAYYVVIANITIPASATVITNTNISNFSGGIIGGNMIETKNIAADYPLTLNSTYVSSQITYNLWRTGKEIHLGTILQATAQNAFNYQQIATGLPKAVYNYFKLSSMQNQYYAAISNSPAIWFNIDSTGTLYAKSSGSITAGWTYPVEFVYITSE